MLETALYEKVSIYSSLEPDIYYRVVIDSHYNSRNVFRRRQTHSHMTPHHRW